MDERVVGALADGLREVAERVVTEAADFVRHRRAEIFGARTAVRSPSGRAAVRSKSTPTDPVTIADTETERLVRDRLAVLRPGEAILGEEQGGDGAQRGAVQWVVDPIDGTVNFVYGIPAYVVSLAAQMDGKSIAGAVADVCSGEVYSAALGGGASVTDGQARRALRCNDVTELSMALVGTGFGYQPQRRAVQAALLAQMLPLVRDIRRMGAAALDLCMVAAGRLDAHYEHGLNVWDWAAGALIAAEAGAVITLPDSPDGLLIAAAPGVADQLAAALSRFC